MIYLPDSSFSAEQLSMLTEAAKILEKAFPGYSVRLEKGSANSTPPAPVRLKGESLLNRSPANGAPPAGSMRSLVLKATTGAFATVKEITDATGLDAKKIRGVLN